VAKRSIWQPWTRLQGGTGLSHDRTRSRSAVCIRLQSVLPPLEVVRNTILRTNAYGNFRCHIASLYISLNILKLHDIYKLELAKLMHKFRYEMLLKT